MIDQLRQQLADMHPNDKRRGKLQKKLNLAVAKRMRKMLYVSNGVSYHGRSILQNPEKEPLLNWNNGPFIFGVVFVSFWFYFIGV